MKLLLYFCVLLAPASCAPSKIFDGVQHHMRVVAAVKGCLRHLDYRPRPRTITAPATRKGAKLQTGGKLLRDGRNNFLLPSSGFVKRRRFGLVAEGPVNTWHRLLRDGVERRDLMIKGALRMKRPRRV